MRKGPWWPRTIAEQIGWITNFKAKIGLYGVGSPLNLSAAQIAEAIAICDAFEAATAYVDSCRSTMRAVTTWRNAVLGGKRPIPVTAAPVFAAGPVIPGDQGIVGRLFKLREQITTLSGYNTAIGKDLGLIGPESDGIAESALSPDLRPTPLTGYRIKIIGQMRRQQQMRIEWRPAGAPQWTLVTFLSTTPAEIQITPQNNGQAEKGDLRAIFYNRNEPFGNYSPNYPLAIA